MLSKNPGGCSSSFGGCGRSPGPFTAKAGTTRTRTRTHTFQKIENRMIRRMPAHRCCCFNVRGSFQLLATVRKLTQLSVQSSRLQESFFNAEQRPSEPVNQCGDIHGCYHVYARILMLPPCQRAHGHWDRRVINARRQTSSFPWLAFLQFAAIYWSKLGINAMLF